MKDKIKTKLTPKWRRWTQEEEDTLRRMIAEGHDDADVGYVLKRSMSCVEARRGKLGLRLPIIHRYSRRFKQLNKQ